MSDKLETILQVLQDAGIANKRATALGGGTLRKAVNELHAEIQRLRAERDELQRQISLAARLAVLQRQGLDELRAQLAAIPEEWREFVVDGEWVRERPEREGWYRIATRGGRECGWVQVWKEDGVFKSISTWEGYWWSVPLPELPAAPKWEDER